MNKITFNPNDLKGMQNLMNTYGDSKEPFCGENENGELTTISIFPDRITVVVMQGNGWSRVNSYYADGTVEETYEK